MARVDNDIKDKAWSRMQALLDKEMPVEQSKRRLMWIWWVLGLLVFLAVLYTVHISRVPVNSNSPASQEQYVDNQASDNQIELVEKFEKGTKSQNASLSNESLATGFNLAKMLTKKRIKDNRSAENMNYALDIKEQTQSASEINSNAGAGLKTELNEIQELAGTSAKNKIEIQNLPSPFYSLTMDNPYPIIAMPQVNHKIDHKSTLHLSPILQASAYLNQYYSLPSIGIGIDIGYRRFFWRNMVSLAGYDRQFNTTAQFASTINASGNTEFEILVLDGSLSFREWSFSSLLGISVSNSIQLMTGYSYQLLNHIEFQDSQDLSFVNTPSMNTESYFALPDYGTVMLGTEVQLYRGLHLYASLSHTLTGTDQSSIGNSRNEIDVVEGSTNAEDFSSAIFNLDNIGQRSNNQWNGQIGLTFRF